MEVLFKVRFMDWRKGDKVDLKQKFADKYIALGVCTKARSPAKRKQPPKNRKADAPVTK